jgi:hypothetical protein
MTGHDYETDWVNDTCAESRSESTDAHIVPSAATCLKAPLKPMRFASARWQEAVK